LLVDASLINVHTIHFEDPELGKGPKKICQAKDSQREVKLTIIIHHHNAYEKSIHKISKYTITLNSANIIIANWKSREKRLVLKDEFYV
jgi:hypothetical protein